MFVKIHFLFRIELSAVTVCSFGGHPVYYNDFYIILFPWPCWHFCGLFYGDRRLLPSTLCFPEHFHSSHDPEKFRPFSKQTQIHEGARQRMRRRTERLGPLPGEVRNGSRISPSWGSLPVPPPPPLSHHLPSPFLSPPASGCTAGARVLTREGPAGEQQGTLLQEAPHCTHTAPHHSSSPGRHSHGENVHPPLTLSSRSHGWDCRPIESRSLTLPPAPEQP